MQLKILSVFFTLFMLSLLVGGVFAETSSQGPDEIPPIGEPAKGFGPGGQPPMNNGSNLDFGLPFSSFADPEYVAQQKFMEGMTAVYM